MIVSAATNSGDDNEVGIG